MGVQAGAEGQLHGIGKTQGQSLSELHEMLRKLETDGSAESEDAEPIRVKIRAALPSTDTGGGLPQKKTPSGRTQVLHMNYMHSQSEKGIETELEHLRFFAKTAQELGLKLEILTHRECREAVSQELETAEYAGLEYTLTVSQNPVAKWAEDSVEYLEGGTLAVLNPFEEQLLAWAMTAGRRRRWLGKISSENLEAALQEDHLWVPLGIWVNARETTATLERMARESGSAVGHIRAYIEGGNMITGEDATGQPVILVGKDAIATTAHLYQLNIDEVKQIIREDFGLETLEQVICVEQPGQFHLDMGILFLGKGVVVVNDSSEALKEATEMAEAVPCMTTKTMAAKLKLQCGLETDAAQDLEATGITVIREKLENDVSYNFFNGEFVVGQDGFDYYITNGGPEDKEKQFETLMVKDWNVVKRVIFSPRETAQKSLQERGGVGCRLKGMHKL
ncbi:MAG: hypothetical protein AAGF01_30170 [Cyanobacteria bacterium P01_G01_bin.38]